MYKKTIKSLIPTFLEYSELIPLPEAQNQIILERNPDIRNTVLNDLSPLSAQIISVSGLTMSITAKRQFSEVFSPVSISRTTPIAPEFKYLSFQDDPDTQSLNYQALSKKIKQVGKAAKLNTTVATNSKILAALVKILEEYKSPNDTIMHELINISDTLVYEDPDNEEILRRLSDIYRREQEESAVRVKILALLSDFAFETNLEGSVLIDEVLSLLKTEKSSKVISMGLHSLHRIGISYQIPPVYQSRIVMQAKQRLVHHNHNVQRQAILVIGAFCPISDAKEETLDLVSKYTDSQDSRVRAQAFRSILTLGKRGLTLPPKLFDRAVAALKDDYECVRREVLQLIFELGTKHPDHKISVPGSDMEIRLVDAAFGRICGAINDLSMQVRTQAAEFLGDMTMVSYEFLQQTLDKKLMSNLRKKRSLHERNLNHFVSGEWSSGKKWADDAPKEFVKAQDVSLMESGACGALVHGLEDEFLEVRTATVETLCRLSMEHPNFAVLSLDFLVDMFNDEIESVRLRAIYSLRNISKHIVLREDQLETMLGALEDFSPEIREGLHLMLGACKMSTQTCLRMVVHKILDVLAKYPQDKESVFGCLQKVGQKHTDLCMSITTQLLQSHPFFDNAEQDVEDPSYVCILILLFNAAQNLSTMKSLMPEMVLRHYSYLRAIKPNFVPQLDIGTQEAQEDEQAMRGSTGSRQFLETLLSNIDAVYLAPRACQALLEAAQENLDRLANIDSELSGTANFTGHFLGIQLLIQQLQSCIAPKENRMPSKESLNLLTRKCLKLQNLFSYLTVDDLFLVKQILLRASALHLVIVVKDRCQSALAPCQHLLQIATDMSFFLQQNTSN